MPMELPTRIERNGESVAFAELSEDEIMDAWLDACEGNGREGSGDRQAAEYEAIRREMCRRAGRPH